MTENRYFADLSPLEHISQLAEPTAILPPNVIYYSGPTSELGVGIYSPSKMSPLQASYNKLKFRFPLGVWPEFFGGLPIFGFAGRYDTADDDTQFCLLSITPDISPPAIMTAYIEYGRYNVVSRVYTQDGIIDVSPLLNSITEDTWHTFEAWFYSDNSLKISITIDGSPPIQESTAPGALLLDRPGRNGVIMIDPIGPAPPDAFMLDDWTVGRA